MTEISLGPILDEDPPSIQDMVEQEVRNAYADALIDSMEIATFGIHHGRPKLMCVCLAPIHAEDLARGYHTACGRSVKVVLSP